MLGECPNKDYEDAQADLDYKFTPETIADWLGGEHGTSWNRKKAGEEALHGAGSAMPRIASQGPATRTHPDMEETRDLQLVLTQR